MSPEPVTNAQLTRILAGVLGRPAFMVVPAFALRTALGDLAIELLGSRRVRPQVALAGGFAFGCSSFDAALRSELER